jgi:iron complex outermembrane receptor protein
VQNVDRTRATGVELVGETQHFLRHDLSLSGWVTWLDTEIEKDRAFPAAVGKRLPQLPRWRGALVATWSPNDRFDLTLAGRYADRMFATIDNSDHYANTYQGFGAFFVADLHARYRVTDHLTADLGVNNLNDRAYFLFHPFPQRTVILDLKYSY